MSDEGQVIDKRDDLPTVLAIGLLAMAISTTAHEAVGHGGYCLTHGGHIARLTSVYFTCRPGMEGVALAGPIGNLVAALLAWGLRRMVPIEHARLRLLLVLVTAFSLFWEGGYVIQSMHRRDGDWYFAGTELFKSGTDWRLWGFGLGVVLYVVGVLITRRAVRIYRHGGALLRWGWLAGSVGAIVAALFYAPDRAGAAGQAALEIGGASWPLLLLSFRIPPDGSKMAPQITRSWAWIGASLILYIAFVATLGRGVAL